MLMMFESAKCVYKTDSLGKEDIPMDILQPILTRRSIRKYRDIPVEDDKIQAMLASARLAPSGNNSQPWNFIIAKSEATRKKIVEACYNQLWMMQAPVFIVCVADMSVRLKELREKDPTIKDTSHLDVQEESPQQELKMIIRDTTIAIDHLILQAESMGLGTCWIAWLEQKTIRPILNIPTDKYVVAVICVGYANHNPQPTPRKPLENMIHYDRWGKTKSEDMHFTLN
jgi:nitroreductase